MKLLDRLMDRVLVVGTLYITESHLIFIDANCRQEKWVSSHSFLAKLSKNFNLPLLFLVLTADNGYTFLLASLTTQ